MQTIQHEEKRLQQPHSIRLHYTSSMRSKTPAQHSRISETCTTFQPLDDNKWLFILSEEVSSVLQSNNEISQRKIQGAWHHHPSRTLQSSHGIQHFLSIQIQYRKPRHQNGQLLQRRGISFNKMPLDNLKQIRHHLDKQSDDLHIIHNQIYAKTPQRLSLVIPRKQYSYDIYLFIVFQSLPKVLIGRRRSSNNCIKIFKNYFDSSSRRHATTVAVLMANLHRSRFSSEH